jgi:hypothetical protein
MTTVKDILADIGIDTLEEFCDINGIDQPILNIIRDKNHEDCVKISRVGTCGYYRLKKIHVGVPLCAHQNPNYSWAAYISDRTPFGVIQHELGHYVDELKSLKKNIYTIDRSGNFSDLIWSESKEKAITSYAPDKMEWFAEIFRLFVTNPDLLKLIRPKAYEALMKRFKPITGQTYKEVLEQFQAPPRVFDRLSKLQK